MKFNSLLGVLVLLLVSCAIGKTSRGSGFPDGFYDIAFYGNSDCTSPSTFTYRQLDICAIDVDEPESKVITTCDAKEFKTQSYCRKDCTSCSRTESGPIGCLRISGVYSILRTCGPAPKILSGNTWLLKYKSASGNCSSSVLESGVVADSCFPTALKDAVKHQCTTSTRTEIKYNNCQLFSCEGCSVESQDTKNDVGKCQDSKVIRTPSVNLRSFHLDSIKWVWQYNHNGWFNYDNAASDVVEATYQEYLRNPGVTDVRSIQSGHWMYQVDFRQMTQQNIQHESHTIRQIRRVQMPVQESVPYSQLTDGKKKYF